MITYRGLPAPVICDFLSRERSRDHYAPGTEFQIGRIDMVANTGTYVDSPFHRFADGTDLAGLELASVADLDAVVVRVVAQRDRAIARAHVLAALAGADVRGKAVLVHTGWDVHFGTERYGDTSHPFLDADVARALAEGGAALVGIDSVNIDSTVGGERPVHSLLLAAGIPVLEHLTNLDALPASEFDLYAVPVKVRGMGTFPVRAFATWMETDEPD